LVEDADVKIEWLIVQVGEHCHATQRISHDTIRDLPYCVRFAQLLGRATVSTSWIDADAVKVDLEAATAEAGVPVADTSSLAGREVPEAYKSLVATDEGGTMHLFDVPPAVLLRDAQLSSGPSRFAVECSLPGSLPSTSRTSISQHQYYFVVAFQGQGQDPRFIKCPVTMHRSPDVGREEQWGPRQALQEEIVFRAYRCDAMWCEQWEAGLEVRVTSAWLCPVSHRRLHTVQS